MVNLIEGMNQYDGLGEFKKINLMLKNISYLFTFVS